ncbi:MAG: sodium:solute symporter family transporter [Thermoguttaceae bacterium]
MAQRFVVLICCLVCLLFAPPAIIVASQATTITASTIATLHGIGIAGPLAGSHQDAIIVGGGANFPNGMPWNGGVKHYETSVRVLARSSDGNATLLDNEWSLPKPIAYAACVSTADGVVCVGGENADGKSADVLRLAWQPKTRELVITQLPPLPTPRTNAAAAIVNQTLYVIGGETKDGPTDSVVSLDLTRPDAAWRDQPSLPQPVSHAVAITQSDGYETKLYLFGGRAKKTDAEQTEFFSTTYSYSPKSNQWTRCADIPVPFSAGCGVATGYSSVLLFGGDRGTLFHVVERLLKQRSQTQDQSEVEKLNSQWSERAETFAGFPRDIFLFSTITNRWAKFGDLPFETPVTTTVFWWNDTIVFPSGEVKPGVRTNAIQGLKLVSTRTGFGFLNYATIAVYFAILVVIGVVFSRKNANTTDFFRGGGRIPWWAIGISIFATALSSITCLSMPAKAFATDWRMLFYNAGILFVAPIITVYYMNSFRNLRLDTAYEFLERRFNRCTRLLASALFCTFMVSRIAIVLFLPSLALGIVTDFNVSFCIVLMGVVTLVYCTFGGMEAVVWGDVLQGFLLVGGAILSLCFLIFHTEGGLRGFVEIGQEMHKFHTFDFTLTLAQPVLWVVILGGFANSLITYSSDQTIVQRYMSANSGDQAVRSLWLNAWISIPVTVLFFLLGTALFTYYSSHPLGIDITLKNTDAIFPHYIVHSLPPGIAGLAIAAIFAAAMSTLSSNINSVSAAITCDFIKPFVALSPRAELLTARVVGIVAGGCGIALALLLATWEIRSLWDQFNTFLGLFTGVLGGLFLMGIFSKRINGTGAVAGIFGSLGSVWAVQHYTSLSFLLYGAVGMVSCYAVGWIVSLCTKSESEREA